MFNIILKINDWIIIRVKAQIVSNFFSRKFINDFICDFIFQDMNQFEYYWRICEMNNKQNKTNNKLNIE
jgi:hypothetical protein